MLKLSANEALDTLFWSKEIKDKFSKLIIIIFLNIKKFLLVY